MGAGISRESDFEGQWDLITGLSQNCGKQRLHSWRAHKVFCSPGPREGVVIPQETEPHLSARPLEGGAGDGGCCGSPRGQGLRQKQFWEILIGVSPLRDLY